MCGIKSSYLVLFFAGTAESRVAKWYYLVVLWSEFGPFWAKWSEFGPNLHPKVL